MGSVVGVDLAVFGGADVQAAVPLDGDLATDKLTLACCHFHTGCDSTDTLMVGRLRTERHQQVEMFMVVISTPLHLPWPTAPTEADPSG